jgi:hypothetical protein
MFFDRLRVEVGKLVGDGAEFENCAVTVERDYRGFKFDVFSVRVLKENPDGKKGILSEPTYYER